MINQWPLHRIWREVHFLFYKATHATGWNLFAVIAALLFALVFFVIGISRVVEFRDLAFSQFKVWLFSILHVLGVTMFSLAMVLFGADSGRSQLELTSYLLLPALAILLPLHIYVNIVRRVHHADRLGATLVKKRG